jgi:hypothetical protein
MVYYGGGKIMYKRLPVDLYGSLAGGEIPTKILYGLKTVSLLLQTRSID